MLKFSILTTRAATLAFRQVFAFFSINSVRMVNIVPMRKQLQVVQPIVGAVKVFVVDFKSAKNWAVKCLPHQPMHTFSVIDAVLHQIDLCVFMRVQSKFYWTMPSVSDPSVAALDVAGGGQTGVQKRRNFTQQRTLLKHALGLGYFGAVQRFTSCCAAHITVIAHLVQIFKAKNWFPRFHAQSPFNMNGSIA